MRQTAKSLPKPACLVTLALQVSSHSLPTCKMGLPPPRTSSSGGKEGAGWAQNPRGIRSDDTQESN